MGLAVGSVAALKCQGCKISRSSPGKMKDQIFARAGYPAPKGLKQQDGSTIRKGTFVIDAFSAGGDFDPIDGAASCTLSELAGTSMRESWKTRQTTMKIVKIAGGLAPRTPHFPHGPWQWGALYLILELLRLRIQTILQHQHQASGSGGTNTPLFSNNNNIQ
eukprot:scaffold136047_cov37-Tisochrysis_lutea.AAC.4